MPLFLTLNTIIPFPLIGPNRHGSPLFRSYLISSSLAWSLIKLVIPPSLTHPDNIPSYPQFSPRKFLHVPSNSLECSSFLFSTSASNSLWPLDICCRKRRGRLVHLRGCDVVPRYSPRLRNSPNGWGIEFLFLFFSLLNLFDVIFRMSVLHYWLLGLGYGLWWECGRMICW